MTNLKIFTKIFVWLVLIFSLKVTQVSAQIIADHRVINEFEDIPEQYIDSVKKMLLLLPGESHGRGFHYGLQLLESQNPGYAVEVNWDDIPESYTSDYLRASRVYRSGSSWEYWGCGEQEFWTNREAIENLTTGLNYTADNYNGSIVFGFGWCWDMTWHNGPGGEPDPEYGCRWAGSSQQGPSGDIRWGIDYEDSLETGNSVCLQTYLDAVEEYNISESLINTIFTTGPVDGYSGESGYQRFLKHEAIREHVNNNGGILFDYADILCWQDGVQYTTEWDGHTYQIGHPDLATGGTGYDGGDGGCHISAEGCLLLGKALWWMLARIAGWDGNIASDSVVSDPIIQPNGGEFIEQVEITLDVSTPGASIYYTVNEDDPDQNDQLYNGPFIIDSNTNIKARAFLEDYIASSTISAEFIVARDSSGPFINEGKARNGKEIYLRYSETIDSASAAVINNYSITGTTEITEVIVQNDKQSVTITLSDSMQADQDYILSIHNIRDIYHNACDDSESVLINYQPITYTGYWDFGTGSGHTIYDHTEYGNHGIITGATWDVNGIYGNALYFELDDTVDAGSSYFGIDTSEAFSVSLWFNYSSPLSGSLIERGNYVYPYAIYASSEREIMTCIRNDNGTDYLAANFDPVADQWYHLVLTYEDGERNIYINGELDNTNAPEGLPANASGNNTMIGKGFTGIIDELGIVNRALSAQDVNNIYNNEFADSNPIIYHPIPDTSINRGSSFSFTYQVNDADEDTLYYDISEIAVQTETDDWESLVIAQNMLNIDSLTGELNWDTGDLQGGKYRIIVQISDNQSYVHDTTFITLNDITGVGNNVNKLPDHYFLYHNYPNPFNTVTTIEYHLPEKTKVCLSIYNIQGQLVEKVINKQQKSGRNTITFDASGLPGGIYYYHLRAKGYNKMRKMILIKP